MDCPKCKKQIPENIDYCPSCKAEDELEKIRKPSSTIDDTKNEAITKTETKSTLVVKCKCGQCLEADWKFCPHCKTPIDVQITSTETKQIPAEEEGNPKTYIIIFFVCVVLGCLPYRFMPVFGLASLATIITAKIKFPNSTVIKVLFWLVVISSIIGLLIIILMIALCWGTITSCPG